MLSVEEEAILVAFRKHTLLPLDDCLDALLSIGLNCYFRRPYLEDFDTGLTGLPDVLYQ